MMRRKIHIFILFLFISLNLSAGKPKNKIKSKLKLNKDARVQKINDIHPYNERIKRSLLVEDQDKRRQEKEGTDSSSIKDHAIISQIDKTRDRRGLSTENFSSYQEINEAKQAKSYNYPFDIDKLQIDTGPFRDNHGNSYTDDTEDMPEGIIRSEEPFDGGQEKVKYRNKELPFWGNRGRQVNYLIGNSGFAQYRRMDEYPNWGRPELRAPFDSYWSKGSRRQEKSRKYRYLINSALGKNKDTTTFWKNRGRDSQMQHLFEPNFQTNRMASFAESNTMLNHNFYADEPHYIIVERSSRSSGEEDPFVISRGKKKAKELDLIRWRKAVKDRRRNIESILKTVNTDPFFIARGKKYTDNHDDYPKNMTIGYQDIVKAKELVCSTIDLINPDNSKSKREVIDRGENNVLKALAAHLQNDPYYVSRGKKDVTGKTEEDLLKEFIEEMADLCN